MGQVSFSFVITSCAVNKSQRGNMMLYNAASIVVKQCSRGAGHEAGGAGGNKGITSEGIKQATELGSGL